MSSVFGPKDDPEPLTLSERVAGPTLTALVMVIDRIGDDQPHGEFDWRKRRWSLSGTSEYSRDPFTRGISTAALGLLNMLWVSAPMVGIWTLGMAVPSLRVPLGVVLLLLAPVTMLAVNGTGQMIPQIEVVDHTTPAEPEHATKLRESYVRGEIDDAELEQRLEEALES